MSKLDVTMSAGQTVEFYEPGDFFRLLKADQAVKVEFYRNGAEISEAEGVTTGYAEKMRQGEFDRVRIYSATAQTVSFVTRMGADVYFDAPPTGSVTVQNVNGAFTQAQVPAVTNSGSVVILAAKANRRYLLVQNKALTGDIFIQLNGDAATTLTGIMIPAGDSFECQGFCTTASISAIGTISLNVNVVVVEG